VAGKAIREHTVAMTFSDTDEALLRAIRDPLSEVLGRQGRISPRPADAVGR
jgi:hypothetical protein